MSKSKSKSKPQLPLTSIAEQAFALFPRKEDCKITYVGYKQLLKERMGLSEAQAVKTISELKDRCYLDQQDITCLTLSKKRKRR